MERLHVRVLSAVAVLILLSLSSAVAASPDVNLVERVRTDRDIQILLEARSATRALDGTFWVYHGINGIERERQAAGVTALRTDGTTRTYLASDILPAGSVRGGMVG